MRRIGTFSIAIGVIGLITILYFNFNVRAAYEELGSLGEIVALFIYGRTNKIVLILLQLTGITLGSISAFKKKQTTGRIGFAACSINLLILFYQSN